MTVYTLLFKSPSNTVICPLARWSQYVFIVLPINDYYL